MEYTLDQIAEMQQAVVLNRKMAIPNLGQPNQSQTLIQGKYSDGSIPVTPPWELMPDGGFSFNSGATLNIPAISPGTWTDVLSYVVPNGFDGVIRHIKNSYNGGGFVDGSGAIIWRILRNGQAVRNYDNIVIMLGADGSTGNTKIRIASNDLIEFQVQNVSQLGATNQIFCYTGGWYYPVKIGA